MSQVPLYRSDLSSNDLQKIFQDQKDFFRMGKTYELHFRRTQLKKLKSLLKDYEDELLEALAQDFGKPAFEAYASEIGFLHEEINHLLKNLKSWARPKRMPSPLSTWPSRSYSIPQPKGICLIIGPWNYPIMLLLAPMAAALAAGNTVFIKPPEQCPHSSNLICQLLTENFDQELVTVVQGPGHEIIPPLLEQHRFDHIFFTGSTGVGRKIAQLAATKLSPCTLELGGKSPVVIDRSANLKVAAHRIAFGKWLNGGQTCVAPDYVLVQRDVLDSFLEEMKVCIKEFYPQGALKSPDYTAIIHEQHYQKQVEYLEQGELFFGGEQDAENLKIAPTLILEPKLNSPLMTEEIFGPILPILAYDFKEEALEIIERNPNPLAFYLFSKDREIQNYWKQLPFGGGAVNNTIVHLANPRLPFGGIGQSGYGHYHGKYGFDTFSHHKALMKSGTWFDLKQKYPPYSGFAYKLVKWLMS